MPDAWLVPVILHTTHVGYVQFCLHDTTPALQHILLHFCGYAYDCAWFTCDSIERIYKNTILFARIYTSCDEKCSYTHQDTNAGLHGG